MVVTKKSWLFYVLCLGFFLGFFVSNLLVSSGSFLPVLSWGAVFCLGALVVLLLILGFPIYRWHRGISKKKLNPLVAFRTLILAKSSMFCGIFIAGWHLGVLGFLVMFGTVLNVLVTFWLLLSLVVLSLLLVVSGFLVENFCRLSDDSDTLGEV